MNSLFQHRLFKMGSAMVFWRIGIVAASALGSVWVVRSLGPQNLGIAGSVQASVQVLLIVTGLLPDNFLVRRFKEMKALGREKEAIEEAVSLRLTVAILCCIALCIGFVLLPFSPVWWLPGLVGILLFLFQSMNASWLLQALERQSAQYKTQFFTALIALVFYLLFFRPGTQPVLYVGVLATASLLGVLLSWHFTGLGRFWKFFNSKAIPRAFGSVRLGLSLYATAILIYLYDQLGLPLVGLLVDVETLGVYKTALLFVGVFSGFLSMIPVLLYPRIIEWRSQSLRLLWNRQRLILVGMAGFGMVCAIASFLLSPLVFSLVLGDDFVGAAYPFSVLLVGKITAIMNGIIAAVLWSNKDDSFVLWATAGAGLSSVLLSFIFIPRFGMIGAATVSVISQCLIFVACLNKSRTVCLTEAKV